VAAAAAALVLAAVMVVPKLEVLRTINSSSNCHI
jgi:hypothetical protein